MMVDPIELILAEGGSLNNLDGERLQTIKDYLDMVLAFAYARATHQHRDTEEYALTMGYGYHGTDLALQFLENKGYLEKNADNLYVVSDKGKKFMEEHYTGQMLWGVNVK